MNLYRALQRYGFTATVQRLYRVRIENAERIPSRGACILAANHESVLDPFILGLATSRQIRYMAKAEVFANPLTRAVMNALGAFPVERGIGDQDAFGIAGRLLQEGEVLGIFPQGTCLPLRRRPWQRGAARLALASGAPLVPVALIDTEKAIRPHRLKLGLPRIQVLVGEPLEVVPQRPTIAGAKALTIRLEEAVAELRAPFGPPAHAWIEG
jgi:1-acyl-sn-glycerol-3-phosphate acyltransferase